MLAQGLKWQGPFRCDTSTAIQMPFSWASEDIVPKGELWENWKSKVSLLWVSLWGEEFSSTPTLIPWKRAVKSVRWVSGLTTEDAVPKKSTRWQSKEQNKGQPGSGVKNSRPQRLTILEAARSTRESTGGGEKWCYSASDYFPRILIGLKVLGSDPEA